MYSIDLTTADAVKSFPFENFIPSFIWNFHSVWSSFTSYLSDKYGSASICSLNLYKPSPIPYLLTHQAAFTIDDGSSESEKFVHPKFNVLESPEEPPFEHPTTAPNVIAAINVATTAFFIFLKTFIKISPCLILIFIYFFYF